MVSLFEIDLTVVHSTPPTDQRLMALAVARYRMQMLLLIINLSNIRSVTYYMEIHMIFQDFKMIATFSSW